MTSTGEKLQSSTETFTSQVPLQVRESLQRNKFGKKCCSHIPHLQGKRSEEICRQKHEITTERSLKRCHAKLERTA